MTWGIQWRQDALISNEVPIYFTSSYQTLFAGSALPRVLEISFGPQTWAFPLLQTDLGNGAGAEVHTAYGYGGVWPVDPFPEPIDLKVIQAFFRKEGVLSAFIRHSPFLANQRLWTPESSEFNRTCYVRDLCADQDLDTFSRQVDQKLRWSINYARRQGLSVEFQPASRWCERDVSNFYNIYLKLMEDKDTNTAYLFSEAFFFGHASFGDRCELAVIRDPLTMELIAGAFFLLDPTLGWAHYHLSASRRENLKSQPMELLLAEAAVRYGNQKFRSLHLGGGHAADASDGLSRFKRKFASRELPFHISKWICDQERYTMARERSAALPNPHMFLISDARGAQ